MRAWEARALPLGDTRIIDAHANVRAQRIMRSYHYNAGNDALPKKILAFIPQERELVQYSLSAAHPHLRILK